MLNYHSIWEKEKKMPSDSTKAKGITTKSYRLFLIMTSLSQQWMMNCKVWWWVWSHATHWPACLSRWHLCHVASHTNEVLVTVANPVSMLSLIAQWAGKDFKLMKKVVHPQEFLGSQLLFLRLLRKCWKDGKIDKSKVIQIELHSIFLHCNFTGSQI